MTHSEKNLLTSRRDWFSGSAAVLGAGAISSLLLKAQTSGTTATTNDINLLNFALRLENLESAFYSQALAMFSPASFTGSQTVTMIGGTKVGANLYSYVQAIASEEQAHVSTLVQTIAGMGGTPQPIDCYNFGLTTADNFIQTAQTLENTGVAAYDGIIAGLQIPANQTLAATIATVEARHAAYLNVLNLALPFPTPFDTTQTMSQVMATIMNYLTTGCSAPPTQLTSAQAGPTKHAIITTNQTTLQLNGSKSTSANGLPLTYFWELDLGSPLAAILDDQFEMATAILMAGAGEYSITLRVTDTAGNFDQDNLKIIYTP